jgi:hypothetical protein
MKTEVLTEGYLNFTFKNVTRAVKADAIGRHMSQINAVDFIVQDSERSYFIEIKDYQNLKAGDSLFAEEKDLKSALVKLKLKLKFYSTLVLELANNRTYENLYYIVILTGRAFDTDLLENLKNDLEGAIPKFNHSNAIFPSPYRTAIQVHNLETWNRTFPHYLAVKN